jgi:hypothetical protein
MHVAMADRVDNLRLIFVEALEFEGRHLPQVLPEIAAPALSFLERLRSADPRLQAWPPSFLMRLVGGAFVALAISESYLRAVEGMTGGPRDYDDLAAILAAGLLATAPTTGEQPP